jgi:subfamily B ATP-binding cassette protein MsbA
LRAARTSFSGTSPIDDRRLSHHRVLELIVGAVGVVIILVGRPSVVSGKMTIGDLFMYVLFTGMMAMPLIQFAAIGTQITEAFAGLDRIREVMDMKTEDDQDDLREPLPEVAGEIEIRERFGSNTTKACRCLKNVSFKAPAGSTTGAGRPRAVRARAL